jgi:CheY-like chemotaxis protein
MPNKRILLIDDEDTIQTVVQFGIRMVTGWDVQLASSGSQGIETARTFQPDVILLDMLMPDMDGVDTLEVLQSLPTTQHIPVIFLTAKSQFQEMQAWHELGVRGVIAKPFNSLDLPTQIARILHWAE